MHYEEVVPEGLVQVSERRYRDRKPFDPLRRADDTKLVPAGTFVSAREEELYRLIDAHIARLREEMA
jgi:hypothetical protein